jgi:hypothetical protein
MSDMNDRELLTWAAKAAGVRCDGFTHDGWVKTDGPTLHGAPTYTAWNPLVDDANAFRLAVKLNLCVDAIANERTEAMWVIGTVIDSVQEPHEGDACAATRRAIVRAAAAIEEQTPPSIIGTVPPDGKGVPFGLQVGEVWAPPPAETTKP